MTFLTKGQVIELFKGFMIIEFKEVEKDDWYIVNDKIECVLETKEEWKIERFGQYSLQSIEMYYDFLKSSDREKDKAGIPLIVEYMKRVH